MSIFIHSSPSAPPFWSFTPGWGVYTQEPLYVGHGAACHVPQKHTVVSYTSCMFLHLLFHTQRCSLLLPSLIGSTVERSRHILDIRIKYQIPLYTFVTHAVTLRRTECESNCYPVVDRGVLFHSVRCAAGPGGPGVSLKAGGI